MENRERGLAEAVAWAEGQHTERQRQMMLLFTLLVHLRSCEINSPTLERMYFKSCNYGGNTLDPAEAHPRAVRLGEVTWLRNHGVPTGKAVQAVANRHGISDKDLSGQYRNLQRGLAGRDLQGLHDAHVAILEGLQPTDMANLLRVTTA